jgi:putative transposase
MAIPYRGNTGLGTYFITASTAGKRSLFQTERMSRLFIEVLLHYRGTGEFLLHEFVLMPDHFHLLLTPNHSLARALQLIKGGFSYRARKELRFIGEVWESSFHDRRVRDLDEFEAYRTYIYQNPVKRGLAGSPAAYPYCSAAGFPLDAIPRRLKPLTVPA